MTSVVMTYSEMPGKPLGRLGPMLVQEKKTAKYSQQKLVNNVGQSDRRKAFFKSFKKEKSAN